MKSKQVVLSPGAKKGLENLLNYLETEWSKKVKSDFVKKLDKAINQISLQPLSGKKTKKKRGVYQIVVTEQTSFYYRIDADEIQIIAIEDNRKNPKKLEL